MVGTNCAVVGCTNNTQKLKKWKSRYCESHKINFGMGNCVCDPPFKLYPFPTERKNSEHRQQWIKNVNRKNPMTGRIWNPTAQSRVCSNHFVDGHPSDSNPFPTISMGHTGSVLTQKKRRRITKHEERPNKKQKVSHPMECASCVQEEIDLIPESCLHGNFAQEVVIPSVSNGSIALDHAYSGGGATVDIPDHVYSVDLENQTDMAGELQKKEYVIQELHTKIQQLEQKVKINSPKPDSTKPISLYDKLVRNDKKCKYYTGLPTRKHFELLYEYVHPKVVKMAYWRGSKRITGNKKIRTFLNSPKKFGPKRKIPFRDELFLVLMKLRLGLMNEDLADRFEISQSSVSSIFTTWIKVLCQSLKGMIYYPDKISTRANLPTCFARAYPRLRCIIDCTEFFIDRPRDLYLQAVTWSDYKKHNTVKVLIGISPRGNISFVSDAWGGRASDRHITLNSDFLSHIDPGDQIMADRGFLVREEIMCRKAELILPPAAKGARQMSAGDVHATKEVANLRIHVERAIQRLKTFRILKYQLPLTLLPLVDDIVLTCSALCNMYPPLVQ